MIGKYSTTELISKPWLYVSISLEYIYEWNYWVMWLLLCLAIFKKWPFRQNVIVLCPLELSRGVVLSSCILATLASAKYLVCLHLFCIIQDGKRRPVEQFFSSEGRKFVLFKDMDVGVEMEAIRYQIKQTYYFWRKDVAWASRLNNC